MSSPMSFPWVRRAGDVAPYHGRHGAGVRAWRVHGAGMVRGHGVHCAWVRAWCVLCMMVGADVPGGPRTRCRPRCRPRGRGAPGMSRPTMGAMVRVHGCGHGVCMVRGHGVCIVHDGRGRRPRRPAYTCRSRCRPRGRGAPGTSRPTMGAPTLKDNLRALRVDRPEDADFAAGESRGESPGRFPGGPEISPPLGAGREIGISRPENRDKGGAVWVCGSVRPSRVLPRRRGVCII